MQILIIPDLLTEKSTDWQPVQELLSDIGHTAHIVDIAKPTSDDIDPQVHTVQQYLNQKTILVSYSTGGRIAVHTASQQNQHIVGVLLFNTPSMLHTGLIAKCKRLFTKLFLLPTLLIPYRMRKKIAAKLTSFIPVSPETLTYRSIVSSDQESLLQIITIKIKLVWAQKSKRVPIGVAKKMQTVLTESDLVSVANETEGFHRTNPLLAAKIIDGFAREF